MQNRLHFTPEAPLGYQSSIAELVLTQNNEILPETESRNNWILETGEEPENSKLSIIVPIHNEQKHLPSFLSALMFLDIPQGVQADFYLVNNASNDLSYDILFDFLENLANTNKLELDIHEIPQELLRAALIWDCEINIGYKIQIGTISFNLINTTTPGKANALNIGLAMAQYKKHEYCVTIDANNYPESDSIRKIYAATKTFEDNEVVVGSAVPKTAITNNRSFVEKQLYKHFRADKKGNLKEFLKYKVNGWMMVFDTNWVLKNGGVVNCAIEDYATGLLAEIKNKRIKHIINTGIWGFRTTSPKDRAKECERFVRGRLRILAMFEKEYPEIRELMQKDNYIMRAPKERIVYLANEVKNNPKRFPIIFANWIVQEYSKIQGEKEYKRNPRNSSWEAINSTK